MRVCPLGIVGQKLKDRYPITVGQHRWTIQRAGSLIVRESRKGQRCETIDKTHRRRRRRDRSGKRAESFSSRELAFPRQPRYPAARLADRFHGKNRNTSARVNNDVKAATFTTSRIRGNIARSRGAIIVYIALLLACKATLCRYLS